jgi:hypothetical protein
VKNKKQTLRKFMESALARDSYDLPSHRAVKMSRGTFMQEVPGRDPNSEYYYFWPTRGVSDERAKELVKAFHGAEGYHCVALDKGFYAFQKPDEPVRLVSLGREKLGGNLLLLICESQITIGGKNDS